MSLLRKKIDREPGLPDHIKNNVKVWQPLHLAVCDMFSSLTQTTWEPRNVDVEFGDLKALQNEISEPGLKFGYGDTNDISTMLVHFDRRFAAHVTTRSLDMSENGEIENHRPELLDLLLFKPIAKALEDDIAKLFSVLRRSATGGIRQNNKGLKITEFELARGMGLWNKVTFRCKLAAVPGSEAAEDDTGVETEEGGMADVEAGESTASNDLVFKMILPQSRLNQLMSKLSNAAASSTEGVADNPWAKHMYQSLENAKVQIKAVVESREMTVADCTRLQIGDVIDLPGVSLQSIGLETDMSDGPVNIATAALGIYKLNRAVKLTSDLDTDFFSTPIVDARAG